MEFQWDMCIYIIIHIYNHIYIIIYIYISGKIVECWLIPSGNQTPIKWACIQMGHGQTHGECCKKPCLRLPEANGWIVATHI